MILNDDFLNRGEVLPHVLSFAAIWNNLSKIYSYRWDEALRHQPENALAMRRDCYIRALLQERAMPTVNRRWQIVGEDRKDPVQKKIAAALTAIVRATPRLKQLLKYLLEATWYGRYGSQVVWRRQRVLGQERWCIARHRPVNGDKIQYRWERSVFLKKIAEENEAELRKAGLTGADIALLKKGKMPESIEYQVHHKIPLDAGGTNDPSNLILMKHEPFHKTITSYQNSLIRGMKEGESRKFDYPIPEGIVYPPFNRKE